MLKYYVHFTVIGFILVFLGAFSLFLNMVGVDLYFLTWLYNLGTATSLLIRITMIILGFALIFIGQTDWSREEV